MEYVLLNNGVKCPVVGIGTFMLSPAEAENSVREALQMGYSLVDTANAYVNERACGRGMRDSGVKREDISFPRSSGLVSMRMKMPWRKPLRALGLRMWTCFTFISPQETGLPDTGS